LSLIESQILYFQPDSGHLTVSKERKKPNLQVRQTSEVIKTSDPNRNMAPSANHPEPEPEYVVVFAGKGTIKREILTGSRAKPTFSTIPQVDFSKIDSPSLSDRQAIAKEVGAAFRDSGFLYAANHGISQSLQDGLYRVIKEFFALPLEEKMKVHINKSASIKGYEALLETKLDATTRGGKFH